MGKTISILGYVVMVGCFIGLFMTHSLFSTLAVVIAIQIAATALLLWARVTFGMRSFHVMATPTEGGLVTTGPYRYIRHPIYTAVTLLVAAGVAANLSWQSCGLLALLVASVLARIFFEEAFVTRRYPEYREYAQRTWRMLPGVF